MKTLFAILWIVAVVFQSAAQTKNVKAVVTTNYTAAVDWFREVNGQLYNTEHSVLWTNFKGDILKVSANGLLIQTFRMKPIYEASTRSIATHNYLGQVTGYRTVPTKVQVDTEKVPDVKFVLRNYPSQLSPTVGQTISFRATRIGTTDYSGDTLELWDYGIPHKVAVISTNYVNEIDAKIVEEKNK